MGAKEQLKELKPLFALMILFEEQRDKDIKLMNAFRNPELLNGIEKRYCTATLMFGKRT